VLYIKEHAGTEDDSCIDGGDRDNSLSDKEDSGDDCLQVD
jgi:hypothetical protein